MAYDTPILGFGVDNTNLLRLWHATAGKSFDLRAFQQGDRDLFRPLTDSLIQHDPYLLLADYPAYVEAQNRADAAFRDVPIWTRMAILNSARMGYFSSDRAIREYCEKIWRVEAVPVSLGARDASADRPA